WKLQLIKAQPESKLIQFQREFASGYEDLLEDGMWNGWYNLCNVLHWYIHKIDEYVKMYNSSKPPPGINRENPLPVGIPMEILHQPKQFNAQDFKVTMCVCPLHKPMLLTNSLPAVGKPKITLALFWNMYLAILCCLEVSSSRDQIHVVLLSHMEQELNLADDHIDVMPNIKGYNKSSDALPGLQDNGRAEEGRTIQ
ncbi:hypothetical protein DACRYDRAFT_54140, partial [Dacryopinax primogenitus]